MNEKITIAGMEYTIDAAAAFKAGVLKPLFNRQVGQFYDRIETPYRYLLSHVGTVPTTGKKRNLVALICISNPGVLFSTPVAVENCYDITDSEWSDVCGSCLVTSFKLVTKSFKVVQDRSRSFKLVTKPFEVVQGRSKSFKVVIK